jgi:probable FeS assembly SUF system protein SufT
MENRQTITLSRDCEAAIVPLGEKVMLKKGEKAQIVQALGGSYTIALNGNMFRIEGADADALGQSSAETSISAAKPGEVVTPEKIEALVWSQLRNCYDPEIPVSIVDLGLVYDCKVTALDKRQDKFRVDIKMTLTVPGCGMADYLLNDAKTKAQDIVEVSEANVELVWDPPWSKDMMSENARLELGIM